MNRRLTLTLVILAANLSGPSVAAQQAPPTRPQQPSEPMAENIAAKVNGRVITRDQVNFMLAPLQAQLGSRFPRRGAEFERQLTAAREGIVQELIDRQILLDEFEKLVASTKPSSINEEIKRQIRELFNGDEAKFREELERSSLTMDRYREMTHEKMVVQAMRSLLFSDAPPPLPNEIENEYKEMKASLRDMSKDVISFRKIFIPSADAQNPSLTPESQLLLAENLVSQLGEGKDFSELAKSYSRDALAANGGLHENVPRADLDPEFAAVIFEAPVGKVLGPLLDPRGFTIAIPIKIEFGPSPPLEDDVREMIKQRVNRKKTSALYDNWIENRRKRAIRIPRHT